MTHPPILIKDLCLSFHHKVCFSDFTGQIIAGDRIAIIGFNGSGKSALLKLIQGKLNPTSGSIDLPKEITFGYVPQVIQHSIHLSGGQRLNKAITKALTGINSAGSKLACQPDVLLMDEPTNHLDSHNRARLMRMLTGYRGTLLIVSHDTELLRTCTDILWHIDNGKIQIFTGRYDDYLRETRAKRQAIEQQLARLRRDKKASHKALMKEQQRAAKSKAKGQKSIDQKKWPTWVSKTKATRAQQTSGSKKAAIASKKQQLTEQLDNLYLPEIIRPSFSLNPAALGHHTILSISQGSLGYQGQQPLLKNISLCLSATDRIAISGPNGSGKSSLVKAILGYREIVRSGYWQLPKPQHIGYLDQHYTNLAAEKSVIESIAELVPDWSHGEVRQHLNDFLFRNNAEVTARVSNLSGGEKARLSLAKIAALPPKLIILDEISNNLDLPTKEHVIQVLNAYPGAILVISHEDDFLKQLALNQIYQIKNGFVY